MKQGIVLAILISCLTIGNPVLADSAPSRIAKRIQSPVKLSPAKAVLRVGSRVRTSASQLSSIPKPPVVNQSFANTKSVQRSLPSGFKKPSPPAQVKQNVQTVTASSGKAASGDLAATSALKSAVDKLPPGRTRNDAGAAIAASDRNRSMDLFRNKEAQNKKLLEEKNKTLISLTDKTPIGSTVKTPDTHRSSLAGGMQQGRAAGPFAEQAQRSE